MSNYPNFDDLNDNTVNKNQHDQTEHLDHDQSLNLSGVSENIY